MRELVDCKDEEDEATLEVATPLDVAAPVKAMITTDVETPTPNQMQVGVHPQANVDLPTLALIGDFEEDFVAQFFQIMKT